MVFSALDIDMVVDSLLGSPVPRVRLWALRRVEQLLGGQGYSAGLDALLWRFLRDPESDLRQAAGGLLWMYHPGKTDDVLLRLVETLEIPPLDSAIPLNAFLRRLMIPDDRIRRILQQLEAKRPTECPLCKKPLLLADRALHMQTAHGFLNYQGDLLPADVVHARLWERILHQQDRQAHEELVGIHLDAAAGAQLAPGPKGDAQAIAVQSYLRGLRKFVLGEAPTDGGESVPVALPYSVILGYQNLLRTSKLFKPIARELVRSDQARLRDLAFQTVLPHIQEQLQAKPTLDELRQLLKVFCPDLTQSDLQIELCRELAQLDTDQALVQSCLAVLQEERLVICPECKAQVQAKNLELHLRRAHEIFEFRGKRGNYLQTRALMVEAVCSPPPDAVTWQNLQLLAEDRHPREGDRHVVTWVYQYIKEADPDQRAVAIKSLSEAIVGANAGKRLLPLFVSTTKTPTWELLGQRLALEVCSRMPPPIPGELIGMMTPILDHKDMPRRTRENAALTLLRSADSDVPAAVEVLRGYVAQTGKKRGLEKLQQLEQRVGHHAAIEQLCQEFEDELRMSCPRCPTELRKKEMIEHLWQKHRLVLDGQRVREPWRVIEDWVVDYGLEHDPAVLQRCRELALKDDPQAGLVRLQRILYSRGVRDKELVNELRAHVKSKNTTLCPHCCSHVKIEEPIVYAPLTCEHSTLEGFGYLLKVSERGLVPSLHIETPSLIVYKGREPGRGLTRLGALLTVGTPMVLMTCLVLQVVTHWEHFLVVLMAAGALGMIMSGLLFILWPNPGPRRERLLRAAWKLLVPEILEEEKTRRAWGFLHGLAEMSEDLPTVTLNHKLLLECCTQAGKAAGTEPVAAACLASLSQRYLEQLRERGRGQDPSDFLLTLASDAFKGKLPLSLLAEVLANFHGKRRVGWEKRVLNRIPILLAARAFELDVSLDDWLNLGRAFPVLNDVLNLEQRWHWQQFHVIWSQREARPWKKVGNAITMQELAGQPVEYDELLSYYPDVLLYSAKTNVVVASKGVWIEGTCVAAFDKTTEIATERLSGSGGGYELRVGYQHIRCAENPAPHLDEIEAWLLWYFQKFVPSVPRATRFTSDSRHRMWQLGKIACPECKRALAACPGDLGVGLR
jgi:hypothetical protein